MKRSALESASLAVAFGAAAGAFVSAFTGLRLPMALLLTGGLSLLAWVARRHPVRARGLSRLPATVRILLIVIGAVALVSRDVPVIADEAASRVDLLAGAALLACAMALLSESGARPASGALLPAIIGLVVAGGLEGKGWYTFVPLACVCATALWTWALVSGGPHRRVLPLALFFLAVAGTAVGTVLFLPWAQPFVEAFVARGLGEGQTGLSDRAQLGDIQKLAPSRRVVARVWTTAPQLLRMGVFTDFDGRNWSIKPAKPREVPPSDASSASGPLLSAAPGRLFHITAESRGPAVETRVVPSLSYEDGWGLLVPSHPWILRLPAEKLRVDDDLGRIDVDETVSTYAVANIPGPAANGDGPPDGSSLWVPPDERIQALAIEISANTSSPREKIVRTIEYLRTHYRYTLEGLPSSLDDFLFEKKAGYCEFFATAAVILLRHQGVPARFVKGVRINPESEVDEHYVVREADAHAWIEAYLPGDGWVEEDPTPASGPSRAGRLEGMAATWEAVQTSFIDAWIRVREGWPDLRDRLGAVRERLRREVEDRPLRSAIAVAGITVTSLAWVFRNTLRRRLRPATRRRQDRVLVPPQLRDLVAQVEQSWARAGRPRPPGRGLQEHLEALPVGGLTSREREAAAPIVATYYRVRYGGATLTGAELSKLREHALALRR